ncbi:MAG: hypothetical protein IT457_24045 [Planctomycetes bacterium]|nr:hypothetical protein [Planctomycetota bacterium]
MHQPLAAAVAFLFLAACAAPGNPRDARAPLQVHEWLSLEYHGRIAVGESLSAEEVTPTPSPEGAARGLTPITVRTALWRIRRPVAGDLLREGAVALVPSTADSAIGARLDGDALEARLAELEREGVAELLHEPVFSCDPGRVVSASVVKSSAFVSGFALRAQPAAMLAEPVIEQARAGVVWTLHCEPGERGITLRAGITMVEECAALPTLSGAVGGMESLAVQVPLACRQQVVGGATLGAGEAFLLAGLRAMDRDAEYYAVVRAVGGATAGPVSAR